MWDPYAEFKTAVLPNGLTVHVAQWPNRPWQTMGFVLHSGAEQDLPGLEGTAHFVEHLVANNAKLPFHEIQEFFDDLGGDVRLGTTGFPYTKWSFFAPIDAEILGSALSLFGDMLFGATLKEHIEREREIITKEFNRQYPNELKLSTTRHIHEHVYKNTFLEHRVSILGSLDAISRISQSNLQSYYNTHYTPANMSVVSVGGLTLEEVVFLLLKSPFAVEKPGSRTKQPTPFGEVSPPTENLQVFKTSDHITMVTPVLCGTYLSIIKIPATVPESATLISRRVLAEILFDEIRKKRQWTYHTGVRCDYVRYFLDFRIECDSLALKALDHIEEVVRECIDLVATDENRFRKVKKQMLADTHMIDLSGADLLEGAMKDLFNRQHINSYREWEKDLEKVTMDDIRNFLPHLRPEMRWARIITP